MTPHEEISAWLADENRDFQKGLELFSIYSRNRAVFLQLDRKKNLKVLDYQLNRLLKFPVLKPDKSRVKTIIKESLSPQAILDREENFKYLEFNKIDPAKLPDDQRKVYDGIAEAYKISRTYHEKMKLATSDEQRGELRAELIAADDIIAAGWNGLDAFIKSCEKVPDKATAKTVLDISKEINACRSYISNGIKAIPGLDEKKKAKRIAEVKKRVDQMIDLEAPVSVETRDSLIKLGIISGTSKIKVEPILAAKKPENKK